jgi:hypothetical protein
MDDLTAEGIALKVEALTKEVQELIDASKTEERRFKLREARNKMSEAFYILYYVDYKKETSER